MHFVDTRHSINASRQMEALTRPASLKVLTAQPPGHWLLVRRGSGFRVLVCGTALAKPHTPNLALVNLLSAMKEPVFLPAGPPTCLGFPQCCLSKSFCCWSLLRPRNTRNGKTSSSRPGYKFFTFSIAWGFSSYQGNSESPSRTL